MSKVIYITKHIGKCNECPHFHEHVDGTQIKAV